MWETSTRHKWGWHLPWLLPSGGWAGGSQPGWRVSIHDGCCSQLLLHPAVPEEGNCGELERAVVLVVLISGQQVRDGIVILPEGTVSELAVLDL